MELDAAQVLGILAAACGTLLLIVYKNQEARVKATEARIGAMEHAYASDAERQREHIRKELHDFRTETKAMFSEMKVETASKREEARQEMHNFRSEIGGRVETVRTETNTRLDSTNVKLDSVANQIGALAILRIRENI